MHRIATYLAQLLAARNIEFVDVADVLHRMSNWSASDTTFDLTWILNVVSL